MAIKPATYALISMFALPFSPGALPFVSPNRCDVDFAEIPFDSCVKLLPKDGARNAAVPTHLPVRGGTARRGAARHGTARHGTARHGTARHTERGGVGWGRKGALGRLIRPGTHADKA